MPRFEHNEITFIECEAVEYDYNTGYFIRCSCSCASLVLINNPETHLKGFCNKPEGTCNYQKSVLYSRV